LATFCDTHTQHLNREPTY